MQVARDRGGSTFPCSTGCLWQTSRSEPAEGRYGRLEIWLYKNTVQIPPLVVGELGGLRRMFVKKWGQVGEARNWTCLMNKNRTVPRGRVRPMSCTVGGFGPIKPTRRDGSRGSSIVPNFLTRKIHISARIASEADGRDPPLGKTQVGKRGIQHRCVFRSERMVWPPRELGSARRNQDRN